MNEEQLKEKVISVLRNVYDPEIPVNIYDLGLIYKLEIRPGPELYVLMTLTAPFCPLAGMIYNNVENALKKGLPEMKKITIEVTFDPPWTPDKIKPEGREKFKQIYGYDIVKQWEEAQKGQTRK